jgi:hypothetical protein
MNENLNTLICPNCGQEINVESVLYHQAESKVKSDFDKQMKQQQAIVIQQKQFLEKEIEEFSQKKQRENELFQEKMNKVKKELELELAQKARSEVNLELRTLQEENEKRKNENLELKKKELEILKKEQEFKEKEEEMKYEVEKKLFEQRKLLEEESANKTNKYLDSIKNQFTDQIAEKEKNFNLELTKMQIQLEQQRKLAEEMKRKADQGSMQLQGEAQEIVLEELLNKLYPFDTNLPVPKGFSGADVIQTVYNDSRQECGKIIYESKKTKNFVEDWIQKLKEDQMTAKAAIAILVTEIMPKDMEKFGLHNGVWVCTFGEVKQVTFILREMLIKEYSLLEAQKNSGDKMTMLYNYLTGTDFKQRIENILDAFNSMKFELEREKRAFSKIWKEREVQIERVISNTILLHSTFSGIAGNSIPALESLKLIDDGNLIEE